MARSPRPPLGSASPFARLVNDCCVGWVHGPWLAASAVVVPAFRLLLDEAFDLQSHAWGLFGKPPSASRCKGARHRGASRHNG